MILPIDRTLEVANVRFPFLRKSLEIFALRSGKALVAQW